MAGVIVALFSRVSFPELSDALAHPETIYALRFTLTVSAVAMAVSILTGVPTAYFLSRRRFLDKPISETFLDLPLVMPPLIAGVGLLFLFGRSLLGEPLARMGIQLVLTPLGAMVAQFFIATPIVIHSARAAFDSVDARFSEAAQTLGSGSMTIFLRVNLPLAARNIAAGLILAWARTMGEFGATLMVAGATRFHTETLPIAVYLNISSGELGIAVSCALVLFGVAFILLLSMRVFQLSKPDTAFRRGV
jgi:molybdate transport system permease protein